MKYYTMKELEVLLGISNISVRKIMRQLDLPPTIRKRGKVYIHLATDNQYKKLIKFLPTYIENGNKNRREGYRKKLDICKNFNYKRIDVSEILEKYKKTIFFNFAKHEIKVKVEPKSNILCLYDYEEGRLKLHGNRT